MLPFECRMCFVERINLTDRWGMLLVLLLILAVNIALFLGLRAMKKYKVLHLIAWGLYVPFGIYSCYMSIYCITEIGEAEKTRQVSCENNLKQIGLALKMYAADNKGYFPDKNGADGLEMLRKASLHLFNLNSILQCPSFCRREEKKNGQKRIPVLPLSEDDVCYVYVGGYTVSDSKDIPIAWDKPGNHKNYGNILYLDGKVIGYDGGDWMKNTKKRRLKNYLGRRQ